MGIYKVDDYIDMLDRSKCLKSALNYAKCRTVAQFRQKLLTGRIYGLEIEKVKNTYFVIEKI